MKWHWRRSYYSDRHQRRSIRLKGYDYSNPGHYFVTICTKDRECLFGKIEDGKMILNRFGEIVRREWYKSSKIRDEMTMDRFIVMPNHVHGIIFIRNTQQVGATGRSPLQESMGPAPKSLGSWVAGFKSTIAKQINELRRSPGQPVWQRNYYDHVIRNEQELDHARWYIYHNPKNWDLDEENPENLLPLTPSP